MILWHNPRCSKSRAALALLQAQGIEPEIREYLDAPPSLGELRAAQTALGVPLIEMIRTAEPAFAQRGLNGADDAALLQAMADEPRLIERPVLFANGRAVIGRPPERVLELL